MRLFLKVIAWIPMIFFVSTIVDYAFREGLGKADIIMVMMFFGISTILLLVHFAPIVEHNMGCNGRLYRSFSFNCISNIKCTKCNYDHDSVLLFGIKEKEEVKKGDIRK
jgi:hypothetical protein